MESNRPYVIWLSSWYPNLLQPYNGDFVRRHAQSASLYMDIVTIHLVRDADGTITKDIQITNNKAGRLEEIIIYYHIAHSPINLLTKLKSQRKFDQIYKRVITQLIQERGRPKLVQVYVAWKAGKIGVWMKQKWNIPFLLLDQWTVYLPEAKPGWNDMPYYVKRAVKKTIREAEGRIVVSDYLAQKLTGLFGPAKYWLIPNVVDATIFKLHGPKSNNENKLKLIHISNLEYQKNPEQILQSLRLLSDAEVDFECQIIGSRSPVLIDLARKLEISELVHFHSEMPQAELAELLRKSDALILYSRYETFGCVLIEAMACGVPVVVSDIPVFRENVTEGRNGFFAKPDSPLSLMKALEKVNNSRLEWSSEQIAEHAQAKYGYKRVGKLFYELYLSYIGNSE